jgi:hypothetical protein
VDCDRYQYSLDQLELGCLCSRVDRFVHRGIGDGPMEPTDADVDLALLVAVVATLLYAGLVVAK